MQGRIGRSKERREVEKIWKTNVQEIAVAFRG
jgi:hypothetical protein